MARTRLRKDTRDMVGEAWDMAGALDTEAMDRMRAHWKAVGAALIVVLGAASDRTLKKAEAKYYEVYRRGLAKAGWV